MTATAIQRRIDFSDAIRACATFSVVLLHVLMRNDWTGYSDSIWWFSDVLHAFAKPAVPLFVMLSGTFLLDPAKSFSLGAFWKKRAPRVFLPFLAWSLAYAVWQIYWLHNWPLSELPRRFLDSNISVHLWFVYMLAGLYLALPILRRFVAAATQGDLIYFLVLWFAAVGIAPHIGLDNIAGYVVAATGFTGYFIAGYWLGKMNPRPGAIKWLAAGITLVAITNAILSHEFAAHTDGYFDEDFSMMNDQGPTVAILSFLVFYFFRSLTYERVPRIPAIAIATISTAGYGIYLAHPMILVFLEEGLFFRLPIAPATPTPWIGIPLSTCMGFTLSLALLLLLDKIPVLRVLAPMARAHEPAAKK